MARIILLSLAFILITGCIGKEAPSTPATPTAVIPTPVTPTPVMTATTVATPTRTPVPVTTPETASVTAEEYGVYEAVMEWGFLTEGIKLVVIDDHTATPPYPEQLLDREIEYIRENLGAALESETLNDYRVKNRGTWKLDRSFSLDVQYVLVSEDELSEIFETEEGWDQFYAIYPNSQGIMTLSRVGFNASLDQALVCVGNQADYLAGVGYYVLLAKEEGAWVIEDAVIAWIS